MRNIIIHYHIYKNAGVSLDSILRSNFGDACGGIEGPHPWDTIDSARVLRYAEDNPNLAAISSHQARLPAPVAAAISFFPVLFLRHPIDRVGSVYSFEHRQPAGTQSPGVQVAQQNDLRGYVRWRLSGAENSGAVIKNFQTVHLSGREKDMRTAVANRADLSVALERIDALEFFGIVELFDESLTRMRQYLAKGFGKIDVSSTHENKSGERKASIDDRIHDLENALGRDLYARLLEQNALDLELYDYAFRRFQRPAHHPVAAGNQG